MAGATIAVASDHAGFDLTEILNCYLQQAGWVVLDFGTKATESVDYPAPEAFKVFLATPFESGRNAASVAKLSGVSKL